SSDVCSSDLGRSAIHARLSRKGVALPAGADPCDLRCCVHEFLQDAHNDLLDRSGAFHRTNCVVTRWRDAVNREQRLHLIWTQALHWGAVLVAMHLMFVADVSRMMNADASALATLTVLALGTFTAGVHIAALRIC